MILVTENERKGLTIKFLSQLKLKDGFIYHEKVLIALMLLESVDIWWYLYNALRN